MRNHSQLPSRKPIRLKSYDYSTPGFYFFTTVVEKRECLLGKITGKTMHLSIPGEITQTTWQNIPVFYPSSCLDEACVMPNHFHGIIQLLEGNPIPLYEIIRSFKKYSAKRINKYLESPGVSFWQRNYYEHIIRSKEELIKIRKYILNNPANWVIDQECPSQNL
jgi:putative transposase